MSYEIDNPDKWRVSRSGYSIRKGWNNEKKIIAVFSGNTKDFEEWIKNAELICELYNASLSINGKQA